MRVKDLVAELEHLPPDYEVTITMNDIFPFQRKTNLPPKMTVTQHSGEPRVTIYGDVVDQPIKVKDK